jgi:hypothetical protein
MRNNHLLKEKNLVDSTPIKPIGKAFGLRNPDPGCNF